MSSSVWSDLIPWPEHSGTLNFTAGDPAEHQSKLLWEPAKLLLLCCASHQQVRPATGGGHLKGPASLYLVGWCRHLLPSHPWQEPFLSSIVLLKDDLVSAWLEPVLELASTSRRNETMWWPQRCSSPQYPSKPVWHARQVKQQRVRTPGPATLKHSTGQNTFNHIKPLLDHQKVSPCHFKILPEGKVRKENTLLSIFSIRTFSIPNSLI